MQIPELLATWRPPPATHSPREPRSSRLADPSWTRPFWNHWSWGCRVLSLNIYFFQRAFNLSTQSDQEAGSVWTTDAPGVTSSH